MQDSSEDYRSYFVRSIDYLRNSYISFLTYHRSYKDLYSILLDILSTCLRFCILTTIIYRKYHDQFDRRIIERSWAKSEVIFVTLLTWEFMVFIKNNLFLIYHYISYISSYWKIKNISDIKRVFNSNHWSLITQNVSSYNEQEYVPKTLVSVFVQNDEVVLVHNNPNYFELYKHMNPFDLSVHYKSIIFDSNLIKRDDLVYLYCLRLFNDSKTIEENNRLEIETNIIAMIYSYMDTYILSENKNSIDRVIVANNHDRLNQLESAIMLSLFLSKIKVRNDYLLGLDYQYLLASFHSLSWNQYSIENYWENVKDILLDVTDVKYTLTLMNKRFQNMVQGDSIQEDILRLVSISKKFYLNWWSELNTDSPNKSDIARVIGQLDAIFWYLRTINKYPLDADSVYDLNCGKNHSEMILCALKSKDSRLGWLKNDQVRIYYLKEELNISTFRFYYGKTLKREGTDILIPNDTPYHTVNTDDLLLSLDNNLRFQVCDSNVRNKNKVVDDEDEIISRWLTQYSAYALVKFLCGNGMDSTVGEWLMTLQGDTCWQKGNIYRMWNEWFCRNIIQPWINAPEFNLPLTSDKESKEYEEYMYIKNAMDILVYRYKFFPFFVSRMSVKDCWKILKDVKNPSHVHIFRGLDWASYIFRHREQFLTDEEFDAYDRLAGKFKCIFDHVKNYTFSNSYKDLYRRDFQHGKKSDSEFEVDILSTSQDKMGPVINVNNTDYNSSNDFGGLVMKRNERSHWNKLLKSLGDIKSFTIRDFLVKSLAYARFRYNLIAHLSYIVGCRIKSKDNVPNMEFTYRFLIDLWSDNEEQIVRFPNPYMSIPELTDDHSGPVWGDRDHLSKPIPKEVKSVLEYRFTNIIDVLNNFHESNIVDRKNNKNIIIDRLPSNAESMESWYHDDQV